MKINKKQLTRIIKEELTRLLKELRMSGDYGDGNEGPKEPYWEAYMLALECGKQEEFVESLEKIAKIYDMSRSDLIEILANPDIDTRNDAGYTLRKLIVGVCEDKYRGTIGTPVDAGAQWMEIVNALSGDYEQALELLLRQHSQRKVGVFDTFIERGEEQEKNRIIADIWAWEFNSLANK